MKLGHVRLGALSQVSKILLGCGCSIQLFITRTKTPEQSHFRGEEGLFQYEGEEP